MKKICTITCYKDPDYIRAKTLRSALRSNGLYEVIEIKNKNKNFLRYPEVAWKVLMCRLKENPDAYLITFRGYEILPIVRLISLGKPLIFDEFINLIEWVVYEHKKIKAGSFLARLIFYYYRFNLLAAQLILADTESHSDYSARLMSIRRKNYLSLPVGTDEQIFKKRSYKKSVSKFKVFFYSNMLPLHGFKFVLEAAAKLKGQDVMFRIVGGGGKIEAAVDRAISDGANIQYSRWLDFDRLPIEAAHSDLCLAGPFGRTVQSEMVITGKAYQFLSMGMPVIVGKNKESSIFSDKENAIIVETGKAESLEAAIRWCMKNRNKLGKIGESGHELYAKKLSVSRIANKLTPRLDELLDS